MIGKIFGTTVTRGVNAVCMLLIVITSTRHIGAEGYGTISLIIQAIAINCLISGFMASPLIYLVPRENTFNLFFINYLWAIVSCFAGTSILHFFSLIPDSYYYSIVWISLFNATTQINLNILLGKEKILHNNITNLIKIFSQLGILMYIIYIQQSKEVSAYTTSLYIGNLAALGLSLLYVVPHIRSFDFKDLKSTLTETIRLGSLNISANFFQFLTYRLSYYYIEKFLGRETLGRYTAGVQLAESIWLVSRSIALVNLTRIANEENLKKAGQLCIDLVKFTLFVTSLMLIFILLIPQSLFTSLLGEKFGIVKSIILIMGPGVLALGATSIFASFFSGIGKPQHNTISSGIGCLITVLAGLLLIPQFGIFAAPAIANLAYFTILAYHLFAFRRTTGVNFEDFFLKKEDFRKAKLSVLNFNEKK